MFNPRLWAESISARRPEFFVLVYASNVDATALSFAKGFLFPQPNGLFAGKVIVHPILDVLRHAPKLTVMAPSSILHVGVRDHLQHHVNRLIVDCKMKLGQASEGQTFFRGESRAAITHVDEMALSCSQPVILIRF